MSAAIQVLTVMSNAVHMLCVVANTWKSKSKTANNKYEGQLNRGPRYVSVFQKFKYMLRYVHHNIIIQSYVTTQSICKV